MIKNNEIKQFIHACDHWISIEGDHNGVKKEMKEIVSLAIQAFNYALEQEDPLKRFEMVNQVVMHMKMLARYDSTISEFLLAKKKMTNYAVLERLSDPSNVSFTLQDCALLSQRYQLLKKSDELKSNR